MAEHFLNEPFEVSGQWYLPDVPQQVVAGILRYTPKHTELHLDDTFRPLHGTISAGDNVESYPLVYGVTTKGEAVTLLNAQRMGISINFGSGGFRQPERLIATLILVGAHVPLDFAYPEISFRIPGLQIWQSRQNIDFQFERNIPNESWTLAYRVQRLPKETTRVAGINSNFEWHVGLQWSTDQFSAVAVTVSAWVTIHPDTPQGLTWYLAQLQQLTTMLTFLAGVPMSPDCVAASIDESNRSVYVMVALTDVGYCRHTNLHDFFITRGTMGIELEQVLARWFEIYPKVHMPSRLAMSILASEKLWMHVEFLSLMQALEGFHRGLYGGNYTDEVKYEAAKKVLEGAIPTGLGADHQAALRSRLTHKSVI